VKVGIGTIEKLTLENIFWKIFVFGIFFSRWHRTSYTHVESFTSPLPPQLQRRPTFKKYHCNTRVNIGVLLPYWNTLGDGTY